MASSETDSVIQVLRKDDFSQQTLRTLPASTPLDELPPFSVRVRSTIIALTVNNLSYAIGGDMLHWWDTYPVPPSLPAPYNDRNQYGIVGAWGFATVLESSIKSLVPGTLLRGYLPVSTLPTVLQLAPAGAKGHWIEGSPHREKLFPLYQRYVVADAVQSTTDLASPHKLDSLAWDAVLGVLWECGYLLNRFCFPFGRSVKPIHPFGNGQWTSDDADLSDTAVVLLAASGKTALSFAQQLHDARNPGSGPLTVVAVTSQSATAFLQGTGYHAAVLSYDDLKQQPDKLLSAINSTATEPPKRILLCDFGARGTVTEDVHRLLQEGGQSAPSSAPPPKVTTLGIGLEARVYTGADLAGLGERAAKLSLVQLNTSGLRDRAIELSGEEAYFTDVSTRWREFKERGCVSGMKPKWGQGMVGEDGVEGFWNRLCGKGDGVSAKPEEGLVVKL